MFTIDFHGYRLHVHKEKASYVSDDLEIYLSKYGTITIIRPEYVADLNYNVPRKIVDMFLTGEILDKLVEQNPGITKRPYTVFLPLSSVYLHRQKPHENFYILQKPQHRYMHISLISRNGQTYYNFIIPLKGKHVSSTKTSLFTTTDEDFRLYAAPIIYKRAYIPTRNGLVSIDSKVFIEEFFDKWKNELNTKYRLEIGFSNNTIKRNKIRHVIVDYRKVFFVKSNTFVIEYSTSPHHIKAYYNGSRIYEKKSTSKSEILQELLIILENPDSITLM